MRFIPRRFKDEKTSGIYDFEEVVQNSQIAVILGEPASGKTYQFKNYEKENSDIAAFIPLITAGDNPDDADGKSVVLLDSIDEAKLDCGSEKKLSAKLSKTIRDIKSTNKSAKFIISCRRLEWKELFEKELEKLDKNIKIYDILELEKSDIELLLEQYSVQKDDFWEFITNNFLHELLKNIMMTINIIKNFSEYKSQSLKYHEIYKKIIEQHLTPNTDNERKEKLKSIPLEECMLISSSLAAYMTLNKKLSVSMENTAMLANEIYKIANIEINAEKLEMILKDTALFVGEGKNATFFHNSIREFLTAWFVNEKKLDMPTIKELFAFEHSFYEEFEEVIIYLSNIEPDFFKHFVDFDPLIFRRHPNLSEPEQYALLLSMLKLLQKDRQKLWGRWNYLRDGTLAKMDKLENLAQTIGEQIAIKSVGGELFKYLICILDNDYSKELEDIVFEVLESVKVDKSKCIDYISSIYVKSLDFNNRLYDFVIQGNLIDFNSSYFYSRMFWILYNNREFKELLPLVEALEQKYIFGFSPNEIIEVFKWYANDDSAYGRHIKHRGHSIHLRKQIESVAYCALRDFTHIKHEVTFEGIVDFFDKNRIYNFDFYKNETDKYLLDFSAIENYFWKCYFEKIVCGDSYKIDILLRRILKIYKPDIKNLNIAIQTYKIELYLQDYWILSRCILGLQELLLSNTAYNAYNAQQQNEVDKGLLQELEEERIQDEIEIEQKQKLIEANYKKAIETLDIYRIFNIANYQKDGEELERKLKIDLGVEKYSQFLEHAKLEFKNDTTFKEYKKMSERRHTYYSTYLFEYLLSHIPINESKALIYSDYEYEKLFWLSFALPNPFTNDYFIEISKDYIPNLIRLFLELVDKFLKHTNGEKILVEYNFKWLFEELNIFNSDAMKNVIEKLKTVIMECACTLEYYSKTEIVEIIGVDKENYTFIKSIMLNDADNFQIYIQSLMCIDLNRAVADYLEFFYPKSISCATFTGKPSTKSPLMVHRLSKYDNIFISPTNIKSFQCLMGTLYDSEEQREFGYLKDLNDTHIKFILTTYFDFFGKRQHHKGMYTPDIYDDMDKLIENIFLFLGDDETKIDFLENFIKEATHKNLLERLKYCLRNAYNQRYKNRNFPNERYKKLLDDYAPNRANARFFDYEKLTKDLVEIALTLTQSRQSIYSESEDATNDKFRDALTHKNYIVADQSRGGESQSGKSVGERDLVVRNKDSGVAESVIEALILKHLDTNYVNTHYDKISNYDTVGNKKNFILVYSKAKNFDVLWEKYKGRFSDFTETNISDRSSVKTGLTKLTIATDIVHIFINFYTDNKI